MGGEKIPLDIKTDPDTQEPIVDPVKQCSWNQTTYKPEYAQLAFNLLSRATTAKNKSHLCAAFVCSMPTITRWERKYPEFRAAVINGLEIGKAKWYNKLALHAFKPGKDVNTGLIKMLSANVYGIKDESEINLNLGGNAESDPIKLMIQRGIPIPELDIDDINDDEGDVE